MGVYKHCRGRICVDGRDITRALPETRGVGIVYQDYVLMPHMTVFQNIAYGLSQQGPGHGRSTPENRDRAVREMADSLHISHLLHRKPGTLSGGEQQRVALGRALIAKPALLLLDEPFSALDRQTRARARTLLKAAVDRSGTTVIHITHDLEDAWALADKLAVFNKGSMLCCGPAGQVAARPGSRFAAEFLDTGVLPGTVVSNSQGTTQVETGWGRLSSTDPAAPGDRVDLFIRREHIHITPGTGRRPHDADATRAMITAMVSQGPLFRISLAAQGHTLEILVPAMEVDRHAFNPGDRVYVTIDKKHVNIGMKERISHHE